MSFFDNFFDERSQEINKNGIIDFDRYDDDFEIGNPFNPVWDGSEIHYNPFGVDPVFPDPNDVAQD